MRIVTLVLGAVGLALGATHLEAQSCYGYPNDFGLYLVGGYASVSEGTNQIHAGVAAASSNAFALRGMYSRTSLEDIDDATGNGVLLEIAAAPPNFENRLCLVATFRNDGFGDELGGLGVTEAGAGIGVGASEAINEATSFHFFAAPQIRTISGEFLGERASDFLWAIEGGVGVVASALLLRATVEKVQDFDDLRFRVVAGTRVVR